MSEERKRAVVEQFDRESKDYLSKHLRAETIREEMRLFDLVNTGKRYGRALDLGCGPGTISEHLLRLSDEVWGVDTSAGMIDLASKRINHTQFAHRLHFEVGTAEKLRFPDGYFDLVFCVGVLRYLDSVEEGIQEIHRVLKPGGVFVATFWYRFSLQWFWMCFLGRPLLPLILLLRGRPIKECFMKYKAEPLPFSHRRFTLACRETGFTDLECQHSGFEFYPLRRLLPSISRYIYLRLESLCFNSNTFGWLGSICIVKGSKVALRHSATAKG